MTDLNVIIKKKSRRRGITTRWLVGSLVWTVIILITGALVVIYSIRDSFYSYAQLSLLHSIEQAYNDIITGGGATDIEREQTLRTIVQEFMEHERYELMALDNNGYVILTSSGFQFTQDQPLSDFIEAKNSPTLMSESIGYSDTGEHIISRSIAFANPINSQIAAIRMVTSLRLFDARLTEIIYIVILVGCLILLFTIFSGVFFIRSIVIPIQTIGMSARRITDGDYSVRIDNRYEDEIGDLCNIINDMAVGLDDAERMKNDFISSVSHELRTPLTAIRGWGETILTSDINDVDTRDKGMKIITGETERLSLMVEDLLDFSRLQTGNILVTRAPIDIVAELSESVMTFENRAKGLGVSLIYEEPPESHPVFADRNRLRQVFSNLLENALKYSRPGDTITVEATTTPSRIIISFTDVGIGIPDDDISRITERYFRAKNSLPGTGIGLSLVKEIMDRHDGELTIDSKLGEGTKVTISLPRLPILS
ncbi:MAG: HAMP domain-containing histidine kinase [Oscillospiraceae bacterium]|nr:HAMP domain-containing histidine kinase [Oscillospiraceae bacterium]